MTPPRGRVSKPPPTKPKGEDSGSRYVVGRKPLKSGTTMLMPGMPVPGAENWLRVESWVRSGHLVDTW
jgi:hypothetical protein